MTARPRVHFSFRSPYSWMAMVRLGRALPDLPERVELVPYWDPDERTSQELAAAGVELHYAQMSRAKHRYILYDTRRQAARLGLSMTWPVDDDPWWELPHLGWLLARRLGRAAEFYAAVTAARWERGEDVCDPAVIRGIGARLGIDGDQLVAAPASGELRAEALGCLSLAYQDDIFGVPYFRAGRHRFWGLDRVDEFVAALRGDPPPPVVDVPEPVAARVGGFDTDTAGGCG